MKRLWSKMFCTLFISAFIPLCGLRSDDDTQTCLGDFFREALKRNFLLLQHHKKYPIVSRRADNIIETFKNPPPLRGVMTIADEFQEAQQRGWKAIDILRIHDIPPQLHKYYDEKGHFHYYRDAPITLSTENGDSKLLAIRTHFSKDSIATNYFSILEKMPTVELWILTSPVQNLELKAIIDKLPSNIRDRVKPIKIEGQTLIPWAQDGSKPISSQTPQILRPKDGNQFELEYLINTSRILERTMGVQAIDSPFRFEGGNIIVGARQIFVGPSIVEDLMMDLLITRKEALQALEAEFGKPIIEIAQTRFDGSRIPIEYHIDLLMALGRNQKTRQEVAFVSSQDTFLQTFFGLPPINQIKDSRHFMVEKGKALRRLRDRYQGQNLPQTDHDLLSTFSEMSYETVRESEVAYEFARQTLKEQGIEVINIPGKYKKSKNQLRSFNFTNVIFSGNQVIIPRYNSILIGDKVRKLYEEMDYEVIEIEDIEKLMRGDGGIRCTMETYRLLQSQ